MMPFKNPLYDSVVGQLRPAAMVEARRVQVLCGGFQLFLGDARATFQAKSCPAYGVLRGGQTPGHQASRRGVFTPLIHLVHGR